MPFGTSIITMNRKYPKFTADELSTRIDEYFIHIKGAYRNTRVPAKNAETKTVIRKVCDREPEPATITGLALFLGFSSRQNFDEYGQKGRYKQILRRGHLRIESVYEQKLHDHYTSGPIFVLKSLGWADSKINTIIAQKSMNIKIIETGPQPVGSEKQVIIEEDMPSIIQNIPMTNDQ